MDASGVSTQPKLLLYDKWTFWAHLPHDTDWSLKSYRNIMTISSVEEMVSLYNVLPDKMIKNCMLFLMRKGINPIWEDEQNKTGGCFSYKISNKNVCKVWKLASYNLVGETLSSDKDVCKNINGITISPKKTFCIVKIWLKTCDYQDCETITNKNGLDRHGCIFKRHRPQF